MNYLPRCALILMLAVSHGFAADPAVQVSGLILPRDAGGMSVRGSGGEFEIEWSADIRVALQVNTRQLDGVNVADGIAEVAGLSALEREWLDDPVAAAAKAGRVVGQFLAAPSHVERLKFVRSPERVGSLMAKFYAGAADGAIGFRQPREGWKMQPYESFLLTQVELEDFSTVALALERVAGGEFLVDWESFVGYCEVPWDQIEDKRPTEPFVVRAIAGVNDYYNHGFTEEEWACVRLADAAGEQAFYGYVKLDDPLLDELKMVLSLRGTTHVTLRVVYPEGGKGSNQLLITGVVARGWVLPDDTAQATGATTFKFRVPSSVQTVDFKLPAGPVTGIVKLAGGEALEAALDAARDERWIAERDLELRFNEVPPRAQLATPADPRFIGLWDPASQPRKLRINGDDYELSLKQGGQSEALLFNILTVEDCKPFVNRATVIGRRMGEVIVADEIHLTPLGDQAALDDPGLPRYLYIGDSISGNYGPGLREALRGKFNLHHPPTNCGPVAKGRDSIVEWLGAYGEPGRHWDVISFNFGHWDASNDKASYQRDLEAVVTELEKTRAKLVWVTTCPVPLGNAPARELTAAGKAPGRKAGVMHRFLNPWAAEVIARHPAISVCDQWQFVSDQRDGLYQDWWATEDVHFGGAQAAALGQFLGEHVERVMAGRQ